MKLFKNIFNRLRKREPESWEKVDRLQAALSYLPPTECPVTNRFTPGLYAREIFVPKDTLVVTKIHKTEHPFVILTGAARVWTEESGVVELRAPHVGVTLPGTRRVLYVTEDCRWITFHPTKETDVDKIESQIIEPRDVFKLGDSVMKELTQ